MTPADLDRLAEMHAHATPGPWYVRFLDDDHSMTAIGIAAQPDTGAHEDMATFGGAGPDLIAATLIQAPPYVVSHDKLWQENADLICAMQNALPDLIRLARNALEADAAQAT
ncbi:hypothetical protein J2W22_000150 [Sphingomonas kyeonggiensis]|uniref:hypothetical protein n=1 Tax=Sphingomonas kyeonggiensis TaxID=1268553 RepID=UPI00277E63F3|nr:hypothetical protein [Sphingomonas kyeonggiensis]MDQ0248103.1 hypothetical protein [Sphingomonas kyeonggiensis]